MYPTGGELVEEGDTASRRLPRDEKVKDDCEKRAKPTAKEPAVRK